MSRNDFVKWMAIRKNDICEMASDMNFPTTNYYTQRRHENLGEWKLLKANKNHQIIIFQYPTPETIEAREFGNDFRGIVIDEISKLS